MLMRMFGVNRVDLLKNESVDTLNVFKETVDKLNEINAEIAKEAEARQKKIEKLGHEKALLNQQFEQNEKVTNKINEFFEGAL